MIICSTMRLSGAVRPQTRLEALKAQYLTTEKTRTTSWIEKKNAFLKRIVENAQLFENQRKVARNPRKHVGKYLKDNLLSIKSMKMYEKRGRWHDMRTASCQLDRVVIRWLLGEVRKTEIRHGSSGVS